MRRLGVCGVGEIGSGIVRCAANRGFAVLAWDQDPRRLEALEQLAKPAVEIVPTLEELAARSDLLLECIVEELDAKATLFRAAHRPAGPGCTFMTATSGLSITEIGAGAGCGTRVVGTHFWNPSELMPLVEVTPGAETSDETLRDALDFVQALGKSAVQVKRDVPGFIGNRLLHAMWREAIAMVEAGVASAEDIDRVARMTFGLRMTAVGPLENMDLVGLDLVQRIHTYLLPDLARNVEPAAMLGALVADVRLGVKSRHGFYNWDERSAEELRDRRDRAVVANLDKLDR